jgi:hypothetical protein
MFMASMILIISVALLLFYLQATCQKILARKFDREYFQSIVASNRLEFPFVRKALEEFDTPVDYPWVSMTLKCDYLALTYLLKNAANARRSYSRDEHLLMLYFRAIFCSLFALHFLRLCEKPAILKLTAILQHFADVVGLRVNRVRLDDLSASDYLLTL